MHYETAEPGTTPSNEIPRVAFSIPRNVGNAVVRNRTKRRLRAVIDEIDRSDTDRLRGDYLIRVTAPLDRWSPTELTAAMTELLTSTRVPR